MKKVVSKAPPDLLRVLANNPKAKALWSTLTPTERRDFVSWIDEEGSKARGLQIMKVC